MKAEESALFTKYYSEWKGIGKDHKTEPALYVKVYTSNWSSLTKDGEGKRFRGTLKVVTYIYILICNHVNVPYV